MPWRARVDASHLRRRDVLWTLTTVAHVVPFLVAAGVLVWLQPLLVPVALLCGAHAYLIPALYAQRGANVVKPRARAGAQPERVAAGLLGDLVDHDARDLYARTGLIRERGALGTWVVGEAGALLLRRPHRVECWCVSVREPQLPSADRIAHLLLALRADEAGFATVANMAFSGAPWRVRARMPRRQRAAVQWVSASSRRRMRRRIASDDAYVESIPK